MKYIAHCIALTVEMMLVGKKINYYRVSDKIKSRQYYCFFSALTINPSVVM